MADYETDLLYGYRRDLDLDQKWWHRLFKVVYYVVAILVVGAVAVAVYNAALPTAKRDNVLITNNLGSFLQNAPVEAPNVIPAFSGLPGRLGILNTDGTIGYASSYTLDQSWCTPDADRWLQETKEHLNETRWGANKLGDYDVMADVARATSGKSSRVCWLRDDLRHVPIDNIIKYEFTNQAWIGAYVWSSFVSVAALAVINLVLMNLYYRGFIYIVCGPRKQQIQNKNVS